MNNIDIQAVHTQTPGVERSYVIRHQQGELEQRVFANELKNAEDEKVRTAQATAESEQARIQLKKENERRKRQRQQQGDGDNDSTEQAGSVSAVRRRPRRGSGRIDILV